MFGVHAAAGYAVWPRPRHAVSVAPCCADSTPHRDPRTTGRTSCTRLLLAGGGVAAYIAGKNSTGGSTHTQYGIAGAVALFVCAYLLLRRVHPPPIWGLSLEAPEPAEPGQEVSVKVDLARGSGAGIEVGIVGATVWQRRTTDHKGRPRVVELTNVLYEDWKELPADASPASLRFMLPLYAQPSGKNKPRERTFWKVVARRRRRLMFDRRVARTLTVT